MQIPAKFRLGTFLACLVASLVAPGFAAEKTNPDPEELVRRAVNNEISSDRDGGLHFMFKDLKRTPEQSQTKIMVETVDATAGLLLMENGRPLSPQQRRDEDARLANYTQNPQELRKKRKQEKEDAEHSERILRALPDALLFEREGTEPSREGVGSPQNELVRLSFRPNPRYSPPSHVEQVLTGMQGHLLIDAKDNRIAEIDGTLEREVGFGWGILGHLDPGGRFLVRQSDVGGHHWQVTQMELSFTGKVLFFKKLNIHSSETFSDFRPVPGNLSFAQGVALLKKEAAENHPAARAEGNQQSKGQTAQNRKGAKSEAPRLCCDR
ncbi:MAG: hypothetical protein J2P13_09220 [Acidobacteria bacterium]|nr:hypothetical protein [Acidobacteriota bacterium]